MQGRQSGTLAGKILDKSYEELIKSLNERAALGGEGMELEVIENSAGNPVPAVHFEGRKLMLHSRFDPVKEAARFIEGVGADSHDLFIVLGLGFAYHVEELARRVSADSSIIIIEKSPLIAAEALKRRQLGALFGDRRVNLMIAPSDEEILDALRDRSSASVSFLTHRGSHQLFPDYYSTMLETCRAQLSSKTVNIATLARFEKIWSSNIARNINRFIGSPGASDFYGRFEGVGAVVVAAGPSLNRSIEFIRSIRGRALIVAVDTAYGVLKKNGITPDFTVAVDPQPVNARYFEGSCPESTVLVADPTVHPSVFRLFGGRYVTTGIAFNLLKWIESEAGEHGEITNGGSVSTNAYDFARRLGCSPVVMVGQDLSFSDGLAHARGSYLDEQVYLRTNRTWNAHCHNRFQQRALPAVYVEAIGGGRVRTNHKMMIFRSWFAKRQDASLINATVSGALIPGVEHRGQRSLRFPEPGCCIAERIDEIYTASLQRRREGYSPGRQIAVKIKAMLSDLQGLLPALSRAVESAGRLAALLAASKRDGAKVDYALGRLAECDRIISSKKNIKDMISLTSQKVIHTIKEGYDIGGEGSGLSEDVMVAKRSEYLYKGLYEGSLFNRKTLEKMLKIIEGAESEVENEANVEPEEVS